MFVSKPILPWWLWLAVPAACATIFVALLRLVTTMQISVSTPFISWAALAPVYGLIAVAVAEGFLRASRGVKHARDHLQVTSIVIRLTVNLCLLSSLITYLITKDSFILIALLVLASYYPIWGIWVFAERIRMRNRIAARIFRKEIESTDTRPYGIWLRPFSADGVHQLRSAPGIYEEGVPGLRSVLNYLFIGKRRSTIEARIAEALYPVMDLIKIGERQFSDIGAGVAVLGDDEWYEELKKRSPGATLVFLTPLIERGSATYLEMEYLVRSSQLWKTIFIMPQASDDPYLVSADVNAKDAWDRVRTIFQEDFSLCLPPFDPVGGVILLTDRGWLHLFGIGGGPWYSRRFYTNLLNYDGTIHASLNHAVRFVARLYCIYFGLFMMMAGLLALSIWVLSGFDNEPLPAKDRPGWANLSVVNLASVLLSTIPAYYHSRTLGLPRKGSILLPTLVLTAHAGVFVPWIYLQWDLLVAFATSGLVSVVLVGWYCWLNLPSRIFVSGESHD